MIELRTPKRNLAQKTVKNLNTCLAFLAPLLFFAFLALPSLAWASEDLYALLGVSPQSSKEDIKQGYRRMAAKFHPDKWVNTSDSDIQRAQDQFVKIRNAYETLSDSEKRLNYDLSREKLNPTWSSTDFNQLRIALEASTDKNEILEKLNELNKFRDYIYANSFVNDPSQPAQDLFNTFERMIAAKRFADLDVTRAFIKTTETWSYYEAENHYTKTLNWEELHKSVLQDMIQKGYSIQDVLDLLKSITMQVDIKLAMPFQGETHLESRPSKYEISTQLADGLLQAALQTNKIKSAQDLFETLELLKAASYPNSTIESITSRSSLLGYTKMVTPWIPQMSVEQINVVARMTLLNPAEVLGFAQNLIENQVRNRNLTPDQLTSILEKLINGTLDHYLKEVRTLTRGNYITEYMKAHPSYNEMTLENWVSAEIIEAQKKGHLFAPGRGHERFLYKVLQQDFLDLLIANKSTLDTSGFKAAQWEALTRALKINSIQFSTRAALSKFSLKKKINWKEEMPQIPVKAVNFSAQKCNAVFLTK